MYQKDWMLDFSFSTDEYLNIACLIFIKHKTISKYKITYVKKEKLYESLKISSHENWNT